VSASVVAIDGGRSGCRVRFRHDDGSTREAVGPPLPYVRGESPADALVAAIGVALDEARATAADVVVAGLAGIFEQPEVARPVAERLADRTGAARVVVTGDLVTAHAGALGLGEDPAGLRPGVVLAAGTGAVAFAVGSEGRTARADGWGYLLGDEGGGFWIGRRGLTAALAYRDGRGGSAGLHARAEARFGRVERLPELVHAADEPAGLIASFAREVAAAAEQGDAVARGIWIEAAEHLAATAAGAASILGDRVTAVSCTGGLFDAGTLLAIPLHAALARIAPALRLEQPRGTPLDGAEALAAVAAFPTELGAVLDLDASTGSA
jgi:glucosamine kinase